MLTPDEISMVADELPVAIWLARVPSGEAVYTNRAFREVLGIEAPPGALRGEFVEPYGVFGLDGRPYLESEMPFERAIAARATVIIDDLVIHRRDGRHVNLRVFAKPLFDAAGEITHVLEAFTDITREIEAVEAQLEVERKLSRSQRLESIGQLVMGISHDFNNLLTVTTLTTSRMLATEREPGLRASLADIESVTTSASELVSKLLTFARSAPQPLSTLDLGASVRSVLAIAQRTFDRRITLAHVANGEAWVRGDQSQLDQVMMNLLVNARDAIAGPGNIVVTTGERVLGDGEVESCPPGEYVLLEVEDDGHGIDPAIRDQIFEPYFTSKTRGSVKGTGLGLSTVLGIVRTHGAFIQACPARPRGTIMRIAFPRPTSDATAVAVAPAPPIVRGAGQLVLIVDDEPLVRSATAGTLRSIGYRALEAHGGELALELLVEHADEIAAVMLDVVMPGPAPSETYARLRGHHATVPVVVVSGTVLDDSVRASFAGVRTWLQKPYTTATLAEVLDSVLTSASG